MLWSERNRLISNEICLENNHKIDHFYRLLFGEVCPENSREITAKSADFSANLSLEIPRNWTFSFCDLSEALNTVPVLFHNVTVQILSSVCTVLKTHLILGGVLEKSLNFIFPWRVLKLLCKSFKSPWIFFNFKWSGLESVFLMLFGSPRQNINYSSQRS